MADLQIGLLFVGVFFLGALPFGVCIRTPCFWKLPYGSYGIFVQGLPRLHIRRLEHNSDGKALKLIQA